ncbi:leucine-rich repeat transmembrane protein FLRT3-like isoform X2 [Uloborus diversus]|uniref:leucine-rich repeat transmembrane protein FLRT3-like isoform X2 n=1 Tax=Uloborus diversus TaxID=327109 RepID=UPI00240A0D69|nr:leucine-rich repeat transmembrane protein FLRT3-like isoform X2 [Uloborus diversus]
MLLHVLPFLLLLVSPIAHGQDEENTCPSADLIKPCKCKMYFDGACILTCSLSNQKVLQRVSEIPNLCSGHVHFVLVHSIVDGLPAKLWKTLLSSKTVDITIKHAKVDGLLASGDDEVPEVYTPGPAVIKVDHSKVGKFDWRVLKKFYSEELTLVIDDTPLKELSSDFSLIAEGQVHKLTIDSTGMTTVPDKLFVPFADITSLSLQNNKLTSVSRSMLPSPASKLQYLHLTGNELTTLPSDLFSEMPVLEVVYLRNNKITTLPQDIFEKVNSYKMQRFDIIHNPWECDCRLMWILNNNKFIVNMGECASPESLKGKKVKDLDWLLQDC